MNRLLLDTNIVIAALNRSVSSLDRRLVTAIDDRKSLLYVSVASLWEIAIKFRLGKLQLYVPLNAVVDTLAAIDAKILQLETGHAFELVDPLPATKDPFDRILLGICAVEKLRLVTTDRILATHPLAY